MDAAGEDLGWQARLAAIAHSVIRPHSQVQKSQNAGRTDERLLPSPQCSRLCTRVMGAARAGHFSDAAK